MMIILNNIFKIHRYFEFFVDIIISKMLIYGLSLKGNVVFGDNFKIRGLPIISFEKGSSIKIGKNCYIISRAKNTSLGVNHKSILRTLKSGAQINIGDYFSASGITICCSNSIEIGNRVMVGANVTIFDTDFHPLKPEFRYKEMDLEFSKTKPIKIEDDVFIGMNSIIMKGVCIKKGSIIAASSVVTKNVEENWIVGGNPATFIKFNN